MEFTSLEHRCDGLEQWGKSARVELNDVEGSALLLLHNDPVDACDTPDWGEDDPGVAVMWIDFCPCCGQAFSEWI